MVDTFITATDPPLSPSEKRFTRSMANTHSKENNHQNESDTFSSKNDNGKRCGGTDDTSAITTKRLRSQQLNDPSTVIPASAANDNDPPGSPFSNHQASQNSTDSPQVVAQQSDEGDSDNSNNMLPVRQRTYEDSNRPDTDVDLPPPIMSSQQRHYSQSPFLNGSSDGWEGARSSPRYSPPPIALPSRSDGLRYSDLDDDNDEDAHYSTFGWPVMDQSSLRESFLDDGEDRRCNQTPGDQYFSMNDNDDNIFLPDRPIQRTLIQDFLQADDYVPSDTYGRSGLEMDSDQLGIDIGQRTTTTTGGHQPTDEMDIFFSAGPADNTSMSFTTKLSIAQQKQEFLALAKPTWITSWPHFLTYDYFNTHDAHDRSDIVPSPPSSPSTTPLDNNSSNNDNLDTHTDDDTSDNDDESKSTTTTAAIPPISTASYFDTKFSVLHRVGSGEYADVWKVWDIESNEVFAIKKLKIPFQSFSDRWLQLVEARNMMMVQHSPYCLNLFNTWEQDGYLYLQTDLAVGTLNEYIQRLQEPIDEPTAWKIIYEIASGLQAIHQAGVVHLDLKPSNIMVDSNGTLKIGDFGTSIRRPLDPYEFKGEGDRHYMAPDLLREEYDTPADVFSLGLVIFQMMTQVELPSTGDSWEMIRLGDFSNYKQPLNDVPLEIRRLLLMMLKSRSDERATMDEILALPHLQRLASSSSEQQQKQPQQPQGRRQIKRRQQQTPGALHDYAQLILDEQD